MTQGELAARWQLSEATLARWRMDGIGPPYLKLHGQVRYRGVDIRAYEEAVLRISPEAKVHRTSRSWRAITFPHLISHEVQQRA